MKLAKYFFASFLLLAIASAFVTPKSHHANPAKNTAKRFTTVTGETTFSAGDGGGDFVIASGTASRLSNSSNYPNGIQSLGTNTSCSGNGKFCKATYTYTYTGLETDPNPQPQDIYNAIAAAYTPANPPTNGFFTSPYNFTVGSNPVSIQLTIVEKN